jgi:hypothetical protein
LKIVGRRVAERERSRPRAGHTIEEGVPGEAPPPKMKLVASGVGVTVTSPDAVADVIPASAFGTNPQARRIVASAKREVSLLIV